MIYFIFLEMTWEQFWFQKPYLSLWHILSLFTLSKIIIAFINIDLFLLPTHCNLNLLSLNCIFIDYLRPFYYCYARASHQNVYNSLMSSIGLLFLWYFLFILIVTHYVNNYNYGIIFFMYFFFVMTTLYKIDKEGIIEFLVKLRKKWLEIQTDRLRLLYIL